MRDLVRLSRPNSDWEKSHLYFSLDAEYSSTYRPTDLFSIPESWFFPGQSVNELYTEILKTMVSWARQMSMYKIILISTLNSKPWMRSKMRFIIVYMYITFPKFPPRYFPFIQILKSLLSKRKKTWVTIFRQVNSGQSRSSKATL